MISRTFLSDIQNEFYEAFKSQDPELFDVVFEIDGKKLYADKLRLSIISSTFKSMLSDRWISKNDAIKIESHKFDDFKEFLTFLYSGEIELNEKNIFIMTDMAEFYQIKQLKELCDEYLSETELNLKNIFQLIEISYKYSLVQIKNRVKLFMYQNFTNFIKCKQYMDVDKSVIKELVNFQTYLIKPEEIFQAVYEWAENQALKKQQLSNDESFSKNDAIKAELKNILPKIEFKKMDLYFLHKYVVKRGFLFTYDELSDILDSTCPYVKVKVTNSEGQSLYGNLSRENVDAIELIKTLKNRESDNGKSQNIFWNTKCKIPSTPSLLKKKDGVKWYLVYFSDEAIGICKCPVHSYILAEMNTEIDFEMTVKGKIEII